MQYSKGQNTLFTANVFEKIQYIEDSVHKALMGWTHDIPVTPLRDAEVLNIKYHPKKMGLSHKEGQARLLHDLGNIELQAMELGLRTLNEFHDAPKAFRQELAEITLQEANHLKLCLEGIDRLGFKWGQWPVHIALWEATHAEDSILDRILIVHRYLEGSGLDAGESIRNKLNGTHAPEVTPVVKIIMEEEVGHVLFGSKWYHQMCRVLEVNPEYDFPERLKTIAHKVPKRLEKMSMELRRKAGFEDYELDALLEFQNVQRARIYKNNPVNLAHDKIITTVNLHFAKQSPKGGIQGRKT